jgi:ligand-binding sensor domain-containing protein
MAVFDLKTLQFSYTDYALNDSTGLKDMYMHGISASRTGDIWVAAGMWGISHMNYQTKKFTHILPNPKRPRSIIENYIRSIYEDKNGIIWAGSHLGGLFRLDPKTGGLLILLLMKACRVIK